MEGRSPEVVSNRIHETGFFERGLTSLVIRYLKPGMVFYDIGAHFGYFSLLASHLVGARGEVHAFEPTPGTYEILKRNTGAKKNVTAVRTAFWSSAKELSFHDYGEAYSAFNSFFGPRLAHEVASGLRPSEHKIQARTVDDYVSRQKRNPDFIKIDAESSEYEILCGMQKTLAKVRPMISLEVGDQKIEGVGTSREIIESILAKDYHAVEFDNGKIADHVLKTHYTYDNLLFLPQ
ncbi:MAG: FkbM family methyltransferase [Candidatus Omnitrophota bacterium]